MALLILTIGMAFLKERVVAETVKRFVPFCSQDIDPAANLCRSLYLHYWLESGLLFL
ncbi:hypothetical protein [Nitrosomonas sp.]|uniref:hypothetical protein n=1 Tax=Nitrosomonas sp. TaxID=42353 RepID=UPI0025E59E98|nr:hypothetical protein [Nitrosomonas sp.]